MPGLPQELGQLVSDTAGGGSDSSVLTTSANHAAGDPIVVFVVCANARTPATTMSDSAGNTYTRAILVTQTSVRVAIYVSSGAVALASGGTMTVVTSGIGAGEVNMSAIDIHAYRGVAEATGSNTGASGEPSVSLTTVVPRTIALACIGQVSGLSGVYDGDADWTPLAGIDATTLIMAVAYRVKTSAGADTWDPTTGLSVAWAAGAVSLAAADGIDNLLTLGVS